MGQGLVGFFGYSDESEDMIAIAGLGVVGSALNRYVVEHYSASIKYDPPKGLNGDLNKADIIFVCVPTPTVTGSGYNLSNIYNILDQLDAGKIVVIKSTVLPLTCKNLSDEYPNLIILSNPEFLSESTADFDFRNPSLQLVGYTKEQDKEIAQQILDKLPMGHALHEVCRAEVAEAVKMCRNVLSAAKIVVLNDLYDRLKFWDISYDEVKKGLYALEISVPSFHLEVIHNGGRGAGGKCLRKDLEAYWGNADTSLMDIIYRMNERLLTMYPKDQ